VQLNVFADNFNRIRTSAGTDPYFIGSSLMNFQDNFG
jgi:hypothetical protein